VRILKDEPDNRILECALSGEADIIVTGDKEMLKLKECEGTRIISLKEYLRF
jgi:predicted nucleic acid-binding protein